MGSRKNNKDQKPKHIQEKADPNI